MRAALPLLAHALAFWAGVAALAPPSVSPSAWAALYLLGAVAVVLIERHPRARLSARAWAIVAAYAAFLAVLFWGADHALNELRGAIRPRAALPAYLGGLELCFMLVPGVASVALAAAWAARAHHLQR
jgi:hypothetical protein